MSGFITFCILVVVMDSPETLKIGSYTLEEEIDHSVGVMSMAWMAPEYIRGEQFSMQSDVWRLL